MISRNEVSKRQREYYFMEQIKEFRGQGIKDARRFVYLFLCRVLTSDGRMWQIPWAL